MLVTPSECSFSQPGGDTCTAALLLGDVGHEHVAIRRGRCPEGIQRGLLGFNIWGRK